MHEASSTTEKAPHTTVTINNLWRAQDAERETYRLSSERLRERPRGLSSDKGASLSMYFRKPRRFYNHCHWTPKDRSWFSKKTLLNIINHDGFIKIDVTHFILITILSLHFLWRRFLGNHRRWNVMKYYYFSNVEVYLSKSFILIRF